MQGGPYAIAFANKHCDGARAIPPQFFSKDGSAVAGYNTKELTPPTEQDDCKMACA